MEQGAEKMQNLGDIEQEKHLLDLTSGKIGKAVSKVPASFGPGSAPTLSGPTALLDARWTTEGSETSRPAARRSFDSFPLKAWHCGMPHMPHMPLSFNIFNLQQLETTIMQSIVLYNSIHSVNSRGSALYIYIHIYIYMEKEWERLKVREKQGENRLD